MTIATLLGIGRDILWQGLSEAQQMFQETIDYECDGFGLNALYIDEATGFCGSILEWANYRADMVERETADYQAWVDALELAAREQDHHDYEISVMRGIPMF